MATEQLNYPRHIAIIMDGNGRWAKKRGGIRLTGHHEGAKTVERVLDYCEKYSVQYLTLYAFSTENWSRPKSEVEGLMKLLEHFLKDKEAALVKRRCRLRVIGRRGDFSQKLQNLISAVEESTKAFKRELIICLSYGGRAEIVDAAKKLASDVSSGKLSDGDIDEKIFSQYLYAPDVPDPDLIIRTSGELRLSNFLLWEAAYSEIYVTPVLWPDFSESDFSDALNDYSRRSRRYGGV